MTEDGAGSQIGNHSTSLQLVKPSIPPFLRKEVLILPMNGLKNTIIGGAQLLDKSW